MNPILPGAPMYGDEFLAKDPAADMTGTGEDKSNWHKVYMCPSCPPEFRCGLNCSYQANFGMDFNERIYNNGNNYDQSGCNKSATWHRVASIKYPSIFVCITDGVDTNKAGNVNNYYSSSNWTNVAAMIGLGEDVKLAYCRHSLNCNYSFGDGHVEAVNKSALIEGTDSNALRMKFYWYPGTNVYGGDKGR